MGTKNNPGKFDCYKAALPDEPMFVLLARDEEAPAHVRNWARARANMIAVGTLPPEDILGVLEALELADTMERWRRRNTDKAPWRAPPASFKSGHLEEVPKGPTTRATTGLASGTGDPSAISVGGVIGSAVASAYAAQGDEA